MRVGMVLAGVDFPPDIRVEKEARALRASGHEVVVLCSRLRGGPARESWEGIDVHRFPEPSRAVKAIVAVERSLLGRDHHWERIVRRMTNELGLNVLHVHDLPVLGSALEVAKIPVVADLHENFPAAIGQLRQNQPFPQSMLRFLDSQARWERHERTGVGRADATVVVVEEAAERLAMRGLARERITVVGNEEDVAAFEGLRGEPVERPGSFVILYAGAFGGRHRGLDTLVDAMSDVIGGEPGAVLSLVGDGAERAYLESRATAGVRFEGWQPFERIPAYISASDVCVVPHRSTQHTETTIPHKLFQYMLMGKPVVVSSCAPLRRVVEAAGAGEVFVAGDARDLARAILRLRDPEVAARAGAAGRRAVLEGGLNWDRSARALVELYARIDNGR